MVWMVGSVGDGDEFLFLFLVWERIEQEKL